MSKSINRVLQWLQGGTLNLLVIGVVILLFWGITAPVGTLIWWLGGGAQSLGLGKTKPKNLLSSSSVKNIPTKNGNQNRNCYIIFLPGVGDFSPDEITDGEAYFLNRLVELHPNCVPVKDVFPYSVANTSLGGGRPMASFWRWANNSTGWLGGADVFIKIRNLWRFAISADPRYGPVYNQGIANTIISRMNAQQPLPENPSQPTQILLVGTSGGVQVSLGATPYLKDWLKADITVVSIGGVFDGEHGFQDANHVYHLWGKKDWVDNIGNIVFASRWPFVFGSPFNRARRNNEYNAIMTGPHEHDGEKGYFGKDLLPSSQTSYVEITVQKVNDLPIWSMPKK